MSKKKTAVSTDNNVNIDDLLIKEYGKIIANADYIKNINYKVIPVTPMLDLALGGGISEGTLSIIAASPKHGKTTLVLQIAKNALEIETDSGPRECYYLSIESRIKERDLFGIKGLDHSRVKIITSTPGNILSGDAYLEIGEKILNSRPGAVVIFDSFSALCSQERMESNLSERFRDNMPLTLASFCRRIAPVISINKSIVLGINHVYANSSGKGHKLWCEASGQKLQYILDTKLLGTYTRPWLNQNGDQIGLEVLWKVPTTYLSGGRMGSEVTTYLKFGEGFNGMREYIDIACDAGIINKASAGWFTYEDKKHQGIEKLLSVFEEDDTLYSKLKNQVNEIFKK